MGMRFIFFTFLVDTAWSNHLEDSNRDKNNTFFLAKTTYVQRMPGIGCDPKKLVVPSAKVCESAQSVAHEETCAIECNAGFTKNGTDFLTCSCFYAIGIIKVARDECEWEEELPTCSQDGVQVATFSDAVCPPLPDLDHGTWQCPGGGHNALDLTDCYATCDADHVTNYHSSIAHFTCTCNGDLCHWRQNPRGVNQVDDVGLVITTFDEEIFAAEYVWPVCEQVPEGDELKFCDNLPKVEGGRFQCTNQYATDSRCKLNCDVGYVVTNKPDKDLACLDKKSGAAEWNREVEEQCALLSESTDLVDQLEQCLDPTCVDEQNCPDEDFIGSFQCSLEVNGGAIYLDGASCELTCPQGFKVKGKVNRKTCKCNKKGCEWPKSAGVVCVLDKPLMRVTNIWKEIKDLPLGAELREAVAQYFASTDEETRSNLKELQMARSLQMPETSCGAPAFDPLTTSMRCTGNAAGAICQVQCVSPSSGRSKRQQIYCVCTRRRCNWTGYSSCS